MHSFTPKDRFTVHACSLDRPAVLVQGFIDALRILGIALVHQGDNADSGLSWTFEIGNPSDAR